MLVRIVFVLLIFPTVSIAAPNFGGNWDIRAQVVSDNCFGQIGQRVKARLLIEQQNRFLSYSRIDGRIAQGVIESKKFFRLLFTFDEIIGDFPAPTLVIYFFSKIKDNRAKFQFIVRRDLESGFKCYQETSGTARRIEKK